MDQIGQQPFLCTACNEPSTLRTEIDDIATGRRHGIYECSSCGNIDDSSSHRRKSGASKPEISN